MAKAKNTAAMDRPKVSADILRQLDELSIGISKVRGTAKCVQLALLSQMSHVDPVVGVQVREYIVKELRRLQKQTESIMVALGGRLPFSDGDEHVID